jgi:hypothetical protein
MRRVLILLAGAVVMLMMLIPPALAQEVTGGCSATINGQTLDTLDIKHPLVIAKGDVVVLTGAVPAAAGTGNITSETSIYVEVVGDIPVATEPGSGPFWGGTVEIPEVLTSLAPGVYKVKGTAEGSGWVCNGSAYVKIEGGPLTAAAAVGAVAAVAGVAGAIRAVKPKKGQVFYEGDSPGAEAASPETSTRWVADVVTFGLFALLVALVGLLGPSWVV